MNPELSISSMTEAEVTLRLAFCLLHHAGSGSHADIAIDGAHVRIQGHYSGDRWNEERIVFDIAGFLRSYECDPKEKLKDGWQGGYVRHGSGFNIKAEHGLDVQIKIGSKWVRVECKGGPLEPIAGKSPNAIFASAIGQVVCTGCVAADDDLWVAVPDSPQFRRVAEQISRAPAFQKTGIRLAVVARDGSVHLAERRESGVTWISVLEAIHVPENRGIV